VQSGGREEVKKYSKDRWIELPPVPRVLMTMVEPERILSSSREASAGGMDVVAQEIQKESRSTSNSREEPCR